MPRFTLRDVFWLVLVVGLALGWWVDHRHSGRRLDEATTSFALEKRSMESMLKVYKYHYRPSRNGPVHSDERVVPDPADSGR